MIPVCLSIVLTLGSAGDLVAVDPPDGRSRARAGMIAGLGFLLGDQNPDGSWGSYREPRARENWG